MQLLFVWTFLVHWWAGLLSATPSKHPHKLRITYWGNGTVYSHTAGFIKKHVNNCSHIVADYKIRNWGLGSDLHRYSQALCNAMEKNQSVFVSGDWVWNDKTFCEKSSVDSTFGCYFGNTVTPCAPTVNQTIDDNNSYKNCPSIARNKDTRTVFRTASMEYLFSNLNKDIVFDAEEVINEVFGSDGVPANMITVHVRWGDKGHSWGNRVVSIESYVEAVRKFIFQKSIRIPHVFLTTEDPAALNAFRVGEDPPWRIYVYNASVSTVADEHEPRLDAQMSGGAHGRISLISLLLALESRYYVLTTGSNWSRLINELRIAVVDRHYNPHHRNIVYNRYPYTSMIDLLPGQWRARIRTV